MKVFFDILRGIVIGIANIIPGVSGGTMAVSMGIYDKLIGAVSNLFKQFKKSILTLLPLGIGMAIGIVGFGFVLEYLLGTHTLATCLAFVGLILGGVPILWMHLKKAVAKSSKKALGLGEGIAFIVMLAIGVGLPLLQGSEGAIKALTADPLTLFVLFALGVIASATMVIPGVSGSMVLMVLGYYSTILAQVTGAVKALVAFEFVLFFQKALILIPFCIGVAVGIFAIAKVIEYLFEHFPTLTYAAIIGLIVSSPFAILYSAGAFGAFNTVGLLVGLVLAGLGAWVTWLMGDKE